MDQGYELLQRPRLVVSSAPIFPPVSSILLFEPPEPSRSWAILDSSYSCLTISTEISTAGTVPLFSSQCVVFLSSGQPSPGP